MIERSINTNEHPRVAVRCGKDATIEGWANPSVRISTDALASGLRLEERKGMLEASCGGNCTVHVPFGSALTVQCGGSARVCHVHGPVYVSVGGDAQLSDAGPLRHANAGRDMDLDVQDIEARHLKLSAGRHLRFQLRRISDTLISAKDPGGPWEATFGQALRRIELHAGGAITLVAAENPTATSRVFGRIEKPEP